MAITQAPDTIRYNDVSTRRKRAIVSGRLNHIHLTKNGVYDPLSYYHVVDALLDVGAGLSFSSRELIDFMGARRVGLVWDPVTVGRIVNDVIETLNEVNGDCLFTAVRRWNGMRYTQVEGRESRVALNNLLADLDRLCEAELASERAGDFPKRINSPLSACASVMVV